MAANRSICTGRQPLTNRGTVTIAAPKPRRISANRRGAVHSRFLNPPRISNAQTPCYDRRVRHRAAYILVGGKSSRFGTDKALLEIEGRPLVVHLAGIARQAAGSVTLVGPPARYQHLGLPTIPDTQDDAGPLAGILAALEHTSQPRNLLLACDMPGLTAAFLEWLLSQSEQGQHDACLPVSAEGCEEPLCAVYAKAAAPAIRREIENGTRKITRALDALAVRRLQPAEYAHLDPGGTLFANINTPADWKTPPNRL
jgi:molybdenum cofactor guanylyltransferase